MGGGDHCAVWGCDNDRRYPEKQVELPHVGVLRFYSPRNKKDISAWEKSLQRSNFKVTSSTKVCSNHFSSGYRSDSCSTPTLYMKGYEETNKKTRPPPKDRTTTTTAAARKVKSKRTSASKSDEEPLAKKQANQSNVSQQLPILEPKECDNDERNHDERHDEQHHDVEEVKDIPNDQGCQTASVTELKRNLFIEQATQTGNCYRYTGLPKEKLDLVFETVKEKASNMRYWKGSVDTIATSKRKKKRGTKRLLPLWDEYILTLVRTRRSFDVRFLADTFGITSGQISRIFNTWVTFLSEELSFLVPWPSRDEIRKSLPQGFKKYPNLRIIIDCVELFIQKPKLPSSQKITWSNYKHKNTAKLLVGITPNGIISFIPPSWTGMVSDKEIVRATGLVNLLEEGDAVMADKGFLIRDILTFKKVQLISPAFCRGSRLSARGTTHTRRVASLRSHVERYILKLKQFRILSGVIPLVLKPMLDRIIFLCAALCNLQTKPIE